MTRAPLAVTLLMAMCAAALGQEPAPKEPTPQQPTPQQPAPKEPAPQEPAPQEPQKEPQPEAATQPSRPVTWTIKFPTELGFSASLDGAPGEVTTSRIGGDFEVGIPTGSRSQLDLGFEYEYTRYEFDDATGFVAGATSPFKDVHRETVRARFGQQETLQLGWMVGGYVGFSAEDGADLSESVVGGLYGGVSYYLSRSLKVGGALGVFARLEDDPLIVPIPVIDWTITEQWRMSNAGKLGLTMYYSPCEQWTLALGAWYDERNFRLDDSGVIPSGVVRDSNVPLQLTATYKPTANFSAEFGGGIRFFGNYEVRDSSRNKVADIDSDPAGYLAIILSVKF